MKPPNAKDAKRIARHLRARGVLVLAWDGGAPAGAVFGDSPAVRDALRTLLEAAVARGVEPPKPAPERKG